MKDQLNETQDARIKEILFLAVASIRITARGRKTNGKYQLADVIAAATMFRAIGDRIYSLCVENEGAITHGLKLVEERMKAISDEAVNIVVERTKA